MPEPTKITKYWPIHKILEAVPDSVELMLEVGLHCFGCAANTEELLHEGMKIHGFTDEEIDEFVDRVNLLWAETREASIRKPSPEDFQLEMIREGNKSYYKLAGLLISEKAFKTLHELKEKSGFQIKIEAGGCNGYNYIYEYKDGPEEGEETFTLSDELEIYMDSFTFDKLNESVVDYESGLKGSGLVFNNPNTKNACHCGDSVGF